MTRLAKELTRQAGTDSPRHYSSAALSSAAPSSAHASSTLHLDHPFPRRIVIDRDFPKFEIPPSENNQKKVDSNPGTQHQNA